MRLSCLRTATRTTTRRRHSTVVALATRTGVCSGEGKSSQQQSRQLSVSLLELPVGWTMFLGRGWIRPTRARRREPSVSRGFGGSLCVDLSLKTAAPSRAPTEPVGKTPPFFLSLFLSRARTLCRYRHPYICTSSFATRSNTLRDVPGRIVSPRRPYERSRRDIV